MARSECTSGVSCGGLVSSSWYSGAHSRCSFALTAAVAAVPVSVLHEAHKAKKVSSGKHHSGLGDAHKSCWVDVQLRVRWLPSRHQELVQTAELLHRPL